MTRCTPVLASVLFCLGSALELSSRSALEVTQRSSGRADLKFKVRTKANAEFKASAALGVMSGAGVTRYKHKRIKAVKSNNEFYWAAAGGRHGRLGASPFTGPVDLTENVSWSWHHPVGTYNTIPVGGPLIDDEMNIYIAADDAIRKFDVLGSLMWSYAPRGQLASAPSLVKGSDVYQRADRANEGTSEILLVGDEVEVLPGKIYHANGEEYYRTGDLGKVAKVVVSDHGEPRAVIKWARTGHATSALMASWQQKFVRATEKTPVSQQVFSALYGTTTSGYAFAIDLQAGEEIWATRVSDEIAGVKGSVAAKDDILVMAASRCRNRYCYRYRNETNNFIPANTVIRGLSRLSGSGIWSFTPESPVWNFVPQFTEQGTLLFQDFQGSVYCLMVADGTLVWKQEGQMGMYTQSAATFSGELNMVYSITENLYDSKWCNPYTPPGILSWCNSMQDTPGLVRGFDASTGRKVWETILPMPPAGASLGKLNSGEHKEHLVIGMGLSCKYPGKHGVASKPSELWALSAKWGGRLWKRKGPTLWTSDCAGDKEGADIHRAMGIREKCEPNSWTNPVIDGAGDVFVGNHVGVLQKWGSPDNMSYTVDLLSTLETGAALTDQSIAMAPGMMVVATCNSIIVIQS